MSIIAEEMNKKMKMMQIVDLSKKEKCEKAIMIDDIILDKLELEFQKKYGSEEWKKKLTGRTVWMINSTASGGGVAEMMPKIVEKIEKTGLNLVWAVINVDIEKDSAFFDLTKSIHNLIHGDLDTVKNVKLGKEQKELFEKVNEYNFKDFVRECLKPDDIVVVHDPQPSPLGMFIKKHNPKQICIWRSHIGLHVENEATKAAWGFLKPYLLVYDHICFSTEDYIPKFLKDVKPWTIVHPSISPYNVKNVELTNYEINSILGQSGIIYQETNKKWDYLVTRISSEGKPVPCSTKDQKNYDFLSKPVVCEISRWDKLKGWIQLIKGFAEIKNNKEKYLEGSKDKESHSKFLNDMVLFLGGPDPAYIQDDPEGLEVFESLKSFYKDLDKSVQKDIYILSLPMNDRYQNALIVNCLQRISEIVVQNSIQEGFGLTCTEALFKGKAVLGSTARGLREQITHGKHGLLTPDPNDFKSVAKTLNEMCSDKRKRKVYALEGKKRVLKEFLIWPHCNTYLELFGKYL